MSKPEVKKLVGRLLSDEDFQGRFQQDPDTAFGEFDLTAEEKEALTQLDLSTLDNMDIALAKDLDTQSMRIGALYIA